MKVISYYKERFDLGTKKIILLLFFSLLPIAGRSQMVSEVSDQKTDLKLLSISTNLLYDAALIPNIGLEVSLGKKWTVGADWFYTWFSSDSRHRYWQGYGGYLTVRRYFGNGPQPSNPDYARLTGHHLGVYALGLTYDVEWGGKGYQADKFGFGGGVEYGYALPIGRRLDLDFSIGIGFQGGEYKEYDPADDETGHYVWEATKKRNWWGPTKAAITLRWDIGKHSKKGGRR